MSKVKTVKSIRHHAFRGDNFISIEATLDDGRRISPFGVWKSRDAKGTWYDCDTYVIWFDTLTEAKDYARAIVELQLEEKTKRPKDHERC